jgi:hypothetical protein
VKIYNNCKFIKKCCYYRYTLIYVSWVSAFSNILCAVLILRNLAYLCTTCSCTQYVPQPATHSDSFHRQDILMDMYTSLTVHTACCKLSDLRMLLTIFSHLYYIHLNVVSFKLKILKVIKYRFQTRIRRNLCLLNYSFLL